ncbi:MAG: enoyl-CoA hydratase/isomerase family protein [Georgfuchsia sp.]
MISGDDVLLTETRGHVYVLTINRPERYNALSVELGDRLNEELERFNADPELWVMILTAAGDKAFCSGMDLKEFSELTERGETAFIRPPFSSSNHPFVASWKPIIAAINGYAYAGGWMLAQRCDLRIMSEKATLGVTENSWNLAAPFIAEKGVFPTSAIAAEVALMARPITAQRAYEIGFVNKVVAPERLMDETMDWANHLCSLGQEAVRGHKQLLYYGSWAPSSEIMTLGLDIFYWMGKGKPGVVVDSTVGSRAFAEKRKPDFSEMFNPKRFRCAECGSEYVVAKGNGTGLPTCHGQPLEEVRRKAGA